MSVEVKVKITSWNCRGQQNTKKVKQVMNRIKTLESNIIFLQETHLRREDELKVRRRWKGGIWSAPFTSQARGVMILVRDSIPLQIHKVVKDKAGRYLIIHGSILREGLILINVYAPNTDEPHFFKKFISYCFLLSWCLYYGW